MTELSYEEFVNYKPTGGGGDFLDSWKDEKENRSIDVVLSRRAPVVVVWRHRTPRVMTKKVDGVDKLVVADTNWVCWESDKVLKSQKWRSKQPPYQRMVPPEQCGICKLIEHVHNRVELGDLHWLQPVFRFDARDGNSPRVIHAGGVYNAYGKRNISQEEIAEMNAAGVFQKWAWKEDMRPKCSYVFRVAQYAHPDQGLQIAT